MENEAGNFLAGGIDGFNLGDVVGPVESYGRERR